MIAYLILKQNKKKSKLTAFTYTSTPVIDKQKLTEEDTSITKQTKIYHKNDP